MNYESLKLKNQLCFPLYAGSRQIIKLYTPFLEQIHLTYTQYIAMMVLWEKQSVTAKELGELLFLDSGTLTPMLKKMERMGLVTRKRGETDERNLIVSITKQGEELREQAADIPEKIGKCLSLSSEEMRQLYRLLYKILEREPKESSR